MTPELQALTQRLQDIEKQIAHLAALVVEQSDADQNIAAQSFVVRDSEGRRRAELGTVIPVGGTEESPWLGLFDANENVRVCIGVGGNGKGGPIEGPWVELYDARGNIGLEIRIDDGRPAVRFFNENGKATLAVATSEFGPMMVLLNPEGKEKVSMSISHSGAPWLVMEDAVGDKVLKLAVESDGPQILLGKDNKVFWSAP
jgi:hypothetical protein